MWIETYIYTLENCDKLAYRCHVDETRFNTLTQLNDLTVDMCRKCIEMFDNVKIL